MGWVEERAAWGQTVGELDLNPRAWRKNHRRGHRGTEKGVKERDGGNYFRFRALGIGYTFSLVSASSRSSSPLPSSSASASLSLRDSSAGQGRALDDPDLAAGSSSIGFPSDFRWIAGCVAFIGEGPDSVYSSMTRVEHVGCECSIIHLWS